MKELFDNPETIKKFKLLHFMLLSRGLTYIENDLYVDYDGNVDSHFSPFSNMGNAYPYLTQGMIDYLDKFFQSLQDIVLDSLEVGDEGRSRVSFGYYTSTKMFSIKESITTLDFDSYGSEFEIDSKELLEDMVKWREEGKTKIKIDFNGGGDSGYIDDVGHPNDGTEQLAIPAVWEDELYSILENNHSGWEINEGSEGTFTINNTNETIELNFRMIIEKEETGYEFEYQFEF